MAPCAAVVVHHSRPLELWRAAALKDKDSEDNQLHQEKTKCYIDMAGGLCMSVIVYGGLYAHPTCVFYVELLGGTLLYYGGLLLSISFKPYNMLLHGFFNNILRLLAAQYAKCKTQRQ
ncbi:hypothetical protein B0H10DRAFT_1975100 [Mycena sp. CBHHK59/15]|nr:hypothetical protein B0H10DRAFT_1975100 [Mycena sp. CBHHK59/15]